MTDLLFLDIETLGIPLGAPIWEFAAVRTDRQGTVKEREQMFVRHDTDAGYLDQWFRQLPREFVDNYLARYNHTEAAPQHIAAARIAYITRGPCKVAGSNATFDMDHLELLLVSQGFTPAWHYHPLDIPSMALGWIAANGQLGEQDDWRSNPLSRALGIEPDIYGRHSADGDVQWCLDQYRRMVHGRPE